MNKFAADILIPFDDVTDKDILRAAPRSRDEITEKIVVKLVPKPKHPAHQPETEILVHHDENVLKREGKSAVPQNRIPNAGFFSKLRLTLSMIKFSHSIFALPFALSSLVVATNAHFKFLDLLMIILACVTARNTAMSFNRIVDADFDKKNPRTKTREIPSGKLSLIFAIAFCAVNAIAFVVTSAYFNLTALLLSIPALVVIMGYSLTKRVTHYTQFFLGFSLGIAPIAAWIAMTGTVSAFSLLLGLAVLLWVAGFDIIYSSLDHDFDKANALKNMVVRWGVARALILSRLLHVAAVSIFILAGVVAELGVFYLAGCLAVALLLVYEHSLVRANDLSRVNAAFFTTNGFVSLTYFIFTLTDVLL